MAFIFAAAMMLATGQVPYEPLFKKRMEEVGAWHLVMADVIKTNTPFLRMMTFHQQPVTLSVSRLDTEHVAVTFDAPSCGVSASVKNDAEAREQGTVSPGMRDALRAGLQRLSDLCPFSVQVIEKAALSDVDAAWLRLETIEF